MPLDLSNMEPTRRLTLGTLAQIEANNIQYVVLSPTLLINIIEATSLTVVHGTLEVRTHIW